MPDPTAPPVVVAPVAQPATDQQMSDLVNSAVSAHLNRVLPKALEGAMAPFIAKIAPTAPAAPVADPSKDPAGAFAELKKSHDTLLANLATERQSKREASAYDALKKELAPRVRPEMLDIAADHLFRAHKLVAAHEDGRVTFAHDGQPLSLVEGVDAWSKTKAAGVFLPPPKPTKGGPVTPLRPAGAQTTEPRETPLQKSIRQIEELKNRA